jgi:hypothetical protein
MLRPPVAAPLAAGQRPARLRRGPPGTWSGRPGRAAVGPRPGCPGTTGAARPAAVDAQQRPDRDAGPAVEHLGDSFGLPAQPAQHPGLAGQPPPALPRPDHPDAGGAACRCQMPTPGEGRKRSRHPVHTAVSRATGPPNQSPTVTPTRSAPAAAAPITARLHQAQSSRQLWRSWSRRRREAAWAEAPARRDRGSGASVRARAGSRSPDEAIQISSASAWTRSWLRRWTVRPAQVLSGRSQRQTRPSSWRLPAISVPRVRPVPAARRRGRPGPRSRTPPG